MATYLGGQISYLLIIIIIINHLGAEEENTVGPEERPEVEFKVETDVNGKGDQAEDEGNEEEDTWGDQKVTVKEIVN